MLALALVAVWWRQGTLARETACHAAKGYCASHGWQLLDYTVALTHAWPQQTSQGWRLKRQYRFEFSIDGGERYAGTLTLLGSTHVLITTELDVS